MGGQAKPTYLVSLHTASALMRDLDTTAVLDTQQPLLPIPSSSSRALQSANNTYRTSPTPAPFPVERLHSVQDLKYFFAGLSALLPPPTELLVPVLLPSSVVGLDVVITSSGNFFLIPSCTSYAGGLGSRTHCDGFPSSPNLKWFRLGCREVVIGCGIRVDGGDG